MILLFIFQGCKNKSTIVSSSTIINSKAFRRLAYEGNIEQIKKIFSELPEIVSAKDENGNTLIYYAVDQMHINLVELLLSKGADINIKNQDGRTPLHIAAGITDDDKLLSLLISKGADVNSQDNLGNTPLHNAAGNRLYKKNIPLLISSGAKVNSVNKSGETPIELTFKYKLVLKDVAQLKDPNAIWSAIWVTENVEDYDALEKTIELLLSKGANPDTKMSYSEKQPVLFEFVLKGQKRLCEILLNHGANVNFQGNEDMTAVHLATLRGDRDIVELLLNKGARINAKITTGLTPLHYAVMRGNKDIVELLISRGADVNAKDNQGQTPLFAANFYKHIEIADLLRKNGATE